MSEFVLKVNNLTKPYKNVRVLDEVSYIKSISNRYFPREKYRNMNKGK